MNQLTELNWARVTEARFPSDWQSGELLDFLELQRGVDLPVQGRRDGNVPIFGSNGLLGFHDASVSEGPGVITGRSGTIGKVFYLEGKYWPLNTSLYVKDFKGNLPKFIYYKLHAIGLERFSTGTGVPTLNRNVAHKERVAFPPIAEQQKIAAILTSVDDKLDVIARQIDAIQTLKQGLMQTLFSRGVGTQDAHGRWVPHAEFKESGLGKIPATWVVTTLGVVCDGALQTGPFGSQLHADEYQDNGVPVLMPKDLERCRAKLATAARISLSRAEELSKHKVFVGDLLFSRRGDVTRFALIDKESEGALCGTGCLKARPSAAHSSAFLAQLLQLDVVRAWLVQNAVGQTMPNMNTGILSSLPLVVPVDRREQDEIARILDSVDSKLQVLAVKQSHFARLRRGLMQKLLTGEWRVSVNLSVTGT